MLILGSARRSQRLWASRCATQVASDRVLWTARRLLTDGGVTTGAGVGTACGAGCGAGCGSGAGARSGQPEASVMQPGMGMMPNRVWPGMKHGLLGSLGAGPVTAAGSGPTPVGTGGREPFRFGGSGALGGSGVLGRS